MRAEAERELRSAMKPLEIRRRRRELTVDGFLDRSGEAAITLAYDYDDSTIYLTREDVRQLRDHLSQMLGTDWSEEKP